MKDIRKKKFRQIFIGLGLVGLFRHISDLFFHKGWTELKMDSMRTICEIVDDFVSSGASADMEDSQQFWDMLSRDTTVAQM